MIDSRKTDRLPEDLPSCPLPLIDAWLKEAIDLGIQRNPNAMTIVSVGEGNRPSARVVLCKEFVVDPGFIVFYTNYQSRKAADFSQNRNAAALFHWDALGRQIRIEGTITKSPAAESDDYFATRGWGSQLGAWGSDQSAPLESREALVEQIRNRGQDLGLQLQAGTERLLNDEIPEISRPPHWGGYRLWPTYIELWVEGSDRIHDRGAWSRCVEPGANGNASTGNWTSTRLQP